MPSDTSVSENDDSFSERCRAFFRAFPVPVVIIKLADGRLVEVNEAFGAVFGWKREDLLGKTVIETGFWDVPEERDAFVRQLRNQGQVSSIVLDMVSSTGIHQQCRASASTMSNMDETHIIIVFIDIHEQIAAEKEARLSRDRLQQLYDNIKDGYARIGKDRRVLECNRAFREMLGYSEEEILCLTPRDFTPPLWCNVDTHVEQTQLMLRGYSDIYEKEQIRKDGSIFPIELQLYINKNTEGNYDGFWGIVRDISQRKAQQASLNFLAYHDPLTQLPNRALLLERLEHSLKRARYTAVRQDAPDALPEDADMDGPQMALLFVDLDRFKNVNDTMGHSIGDIVLQIMAHKMSCLLRESDLLTRIGGDEFIILLEPPITAAAAAGVATRVLSLFTAPIPLQDQEIYLSASIGISLFPKDGEDPEVLIKHADIAMFKAKEEGRNCLRFYEAEMGACILERMELEHDLRGALQRNELILYYQPQISLNTRELAGVEALLRWQHPARGMISPAHFIPIAEDIGVISDIGAWVLRQACDQVAQWKTEGFEMPRVAVNLSAQQLERSDLVSIVQHALEKNALPPSMLELEVTESILMKKTEQTLAILNGLKHMGVQLAIDDFGTGYSSLGYLKTLPVHRLKIDYSFVRDIGLDSNDEAITRAVIALSTSLGLETVAEGVEREDQEIFLKKEGCQIVQGFRYAHPLPAGELRTRYGHAHA
ncbi:MAG: EAL domain-containing protein [Azoarcus sp.]|jgi:diguanylate cyclase (GGDEF)-like protein/PAS domain S-box-containing protein|nr:EAL domain-containing protein [Azoarcus sp.]